MPMFRKKPVVVEARQFDGNWHDWFVSWMGLPETAYGVLEVGGKLVPRLLIDTLEGTHRADVGDWIIKGVKGEFYPCKPDIFASTYEAAD